MFEAIEDLFVDSISGVRLGEPEYFVPHRPNRRERVLEKVEAHYGSCAAGELRQARYSGCASSVELSLQALGPDPQADLVVLVQSYPDLEPLAAPLQRILERGRMRPARFAGLTHLGDRGGSEALRPVSWLLEPGARGVLLFTEFLPYRHQHAENRASGAACVRLSRAGGIWKILGIGSARVMEANQRIISPAKEGPDYGCADGWIRLADEDRAPGKRVVLVRDDSAVLLEATGRPA
jgi:hypothetical protein